ncbi:hypothetical protein GGD65_004552 [Bradyrhizobium sp. CIR18]|uniref:hypothetical protein n=1 Tax=Bradyrhizobium sp. CIR18 TaxID=2663839 RepID=UPI0016062871|nr:hypothetical protein [Bradyrhizobium sp. CIR18]MBB4363507.1 hypothetical protein [Bradyrhizobium sp. CIR18]
MSAVLTEKTPAEPPRAWFLNKTQEILSVLLTRRLRKAEAELVALHDRVLEIIGLDRSEIGSAVLEDAQERTIACGRSVDTT